MNMRKILKHEFNKVIDFANKQFNLDFVSFLPRIYGDKDNYKYHYIYEVNKELLGMFLAKPYRYGNLKMLGIGSLCVEKNHRNKGIMQDMFHFIEKELEINHDILYLSGDKTRYEHFGYYKSGVKCTLRIKEKNLEEFDISKMMIRVAEDCHTLSILKENYQRSLETFANIARDSQKIIYVFSEEQKQGYAIYDKKTNEILEICGNIEELKIIKSIILKNKGIFVHYITNMKKAKKFYEYAEDYSITNLVNIKIINYKKVIKNLLKKVENKQKGKIILRTKDRTICIKVTNKNIKVNEILENNQIYLSEREMIDVLFGNPNFISQEMGLDMNLICSWFPLPLPSTLSSIDGV